MKQNLSPSPKHKHLATYIVFYVTHHNIICQVFPGIPIGLILLLKSVVSSLPLSCVCDLVVLALIMINFVERKGKQMI